MTFSRDQLIGQLPRWQSATDVAEPNDVLMAYLCQYQLAEIAACHHYQIGLMEIPELQFALQRFTPQDGCRATVVVSHGYMDHMGLYGHLITHLLNLNVEVYLYDLAGHGLSGGEPLAVDNFDVYARQLQKVLAHIEVTERPLLLIGQSTGGAVIGAHEWLIGDDDGPPIRQRILLAPLVRPALWRAIRRQFHLVKHFLKQVPRRYTANSHDAAFMRFLRQSDPMQHGDIPLSWIAAMQSWADYIESADPHDSAVTCIQGMADSTVDWHHNLRVLHRVYPEMKVELIEGARHHLVNESDTYRIPVFQRISEVINRVCPDVKITERAE